MISAITGELRRVEEDRVSVQCGPILYELLIPAADTTELQVNLGEQITFHTIFYLEGDAARGNLEPRLIGFLRADDRKFFERFTTVKGIGPKTAVQLITRYGGVDDILTAAKEGRIPGERGKLVARHEETVDLARRLVTIQRDLDLGEQPLELGRRKAGARGLTALLEELEFPSLIRDWGLTRFVGAPPRAEPAPLPEISEILSAPDAPEPERKEPATAEKPTQISLF